MKGIAQVMLLLDMMCSGIYGGCTLPTVLDGTWWDSRYNAAVSFTQSTGKVNSGWNIQSFSSTMSSYTCVESDSSYWVFQSGTTVHFFGQNYYGFLCLEYTKITDNSYSYYLNADIDTDASSTRIKMLSENEVTTGITISQVCTPTSGPGTEEFHVLVKENQQANVKQWFPDAILGQYAYSVTDASSTTTCGAGSMWDACTNRTTVTFNYTQCDTVMFGSTGSELYATQHATSGSTTYVILVNGDANPTNIFTCLAISGTSVSSNPGSCALGQSATSRTSSSDSVLITLTAYELCPFSSDSSSSNVGLIVGLVIVSILIVGVVAFVVYCKVRKKKPFPCEKPKIQNGTEENAEQPTKADIERTIFFPRCFDSVSKTVLDVEAVDMVTSDVNKTPEKKRSLSRSTPEKKQTTPRLTPEKKQPTPRLTPEKTKSLLRLKNTTPETDVNKNKL